MNQTQAKSREKSLNFATVEKLLKLHFLNPENLIIWPAKKVMRQVERQVASCQQNGTAQDNFWTAWKELICGSERFESIRIRKNLIVGSGFSDPDDFILCGSRESAVLYFHPGLPWHM